MQNKTIFFLNKSFYFLNHHNFFFFFFLQFKERKTYFNTLECLFCYSYYILHNTGCKTLHELYLWLMRMLVSEVSQTDDSGKVSEVGHGAKMWARLMMSWVRLMIMRLVRLIWWVMKVMKLMNDDEWWKSWNWWMMSDEWLWAG